MHFNPWMWRSIAELTRSTIISSDLWRPTFTRPIWVVSLFTPPLRGARWMASGGLPPKPLQSKSSVIWTAYCLSLDDKMSHPPLNAKCPFPRVPTKIVDFVNKTKNLIVFSFIVKRTTQTSMQVPEYVQPSTHVQLPTCWNSRPPFSHVRFLQTVHSRPSLRSKPKPGIYPNS